MIYNRNIGVLIHLRVKTVRICIMHSFTNKIIIFRVEQHLILIAHVLILDECHEIPNGPDGWILKVT